MNIGEPGLIGGARVGVGIIAVVVSIVVVVIIKRSTALVRVV